MWFLLYFTFFWVFGEPASAKLPSGQEIPYEARAISQGGDLVTFDYKFGLSPKSDHKYSLQSSGGESPQNWPLSFVRSEGSRVYLKLPKKTFTEWSVFIKSGPRLRITNSDSQVLDQTHWQWARSLDERFTTNFPLGVLLERDSTIFRLWAPTALAIEVEVFDSPSEESFIESIPMKESATQNLWVAESPRNLQNKFYLYKITLYHPIQAKVVTLKVVDPYALSLSLNSSFGQILDLDSQKTKPTNWDASQRPKISSPTDAVIYEVHLRDATAKDQSLPKNLRGTYLGLVDPRGRAFHHLKALAEAGLTHVHILPFADFSSVEENKSLWKIEEPLESPPWGSDEPQALVGKNRQQDGYNWGYDPVQYFSPEGTYAVRNEDRVLELRTMISELHKIGLSVVQDVVFNHTYASGFFKYSILDLIVPFYYYRYTDVGFVESSSCCADTASENVMMERLMIDAVTHWAREYKIDGFRFDLMSFHTKSNLRKVRRALNANLKSSQSLIYGEAWNFGSLTARRPREALTQLNSTGEGLGIFNDRLRDALRGGTTNSSEKSDQGWLTGLWDDFNSEPANRNTPLDPGERQQKFLALTDIVKIGLIGNLASYKLKDHQGNFVLAKDIYFRGQPVAYADSPRESVNYSSAHDGYTLWDAIQAKLPFFTPQRLPPIASLEEKVAIQKLGISVILSSVGIPFIESGTEILRSKSGDQNSYDSGDWFNALDFSLKKNGWGLGLPPAWQNQEDWSFWRPRLMEPQLQLRQLSRQVDPIKAVLEHTKAWLRVRKAYPALRVESSEVVKEHFRFIDQTPEAKPGLIALEINFNQKKFLLGFNASKETIELPLPESYFSVELVSELKTLYQGQNIKFSFDFIEKTLSLPPRSSGFFEVLSL